MAGWSVTAFVVCLAAILAVYHYRQRQDVYLRTVLQGMLSLEENTPLENPPRIAAAFEATIDLFTDTLGVFESMGLSPPENAVAHDVVTNEQEMAETFAYFFSRGAGSSRYVANKEFFRAFVKKVRAHNSTRGVLGGSGYQMARRFVEEGCETLVAADFTKDSQNMLPKGVAIAGDMANEDDIHLLLEFPLDATWGQFTSPRANRLVLHSDENNPYLKSLDKFESMLGDFKPSAVAIAGLHMLDNFPFKQGERKQLLAKLKKFLLRVPKEIPIHFEMGVFHEEALMDDLMEYVFPYADSLGLNEQELPNLHSKLMQGKVKKSSSQKPRVAKALDLMRAIYQRMQESRPEDSNRLLTRIHMHTLAFQVVMTAKESTWKNSQAAAAKASLTATRWVCGSANIDTAKSKMFMDDSFSVSVTSNSHRVPFNASAPVSCWDESSYELCVAPVLVCTQIYQTGGGGDNISSAGLLLQL